MLGDEALLNYYELVAIGLQSLFLLIFLVPAQSILRKH